MNVAGGKLSKVGLHVVLCLAAHLEVNLVLEGCCRTPFHGVRLPCSDLLGGIDVESRV